MLRAHSPAQQLCQVVPGHSALQPRTPTGVNYRWLLSRRDQSRTRVWVPLIPAGTWVWVPGSQLELRPGPPSQPALGSGSPDPSLSPFPLCLPQSLKNRLAENSRSAGHVPLGARAWEPRCAGVGTLQAKEGGSDFVPTSKMKSGTWRHGRPFFRGAGRGRREADSHAENQGRKGSFGGFLRQRIEAPPHNLVGIEQGAP